MTGIPFVPADKRDRRCRTAEIVLRDVELLGDEQAAEDEGKQVVVMVSLGWGERAPWPG
jgi:hypothetical protein